MAPESRRQTFMEGAPAEAQGTVGIEAEASAPSARMAGKFLRAGLRGSSGVAGKLICGTGKGITRFGGFEYGYQQGVLGQSLVMYKFKKNFPKLVASAGATGWLTPILQLGGWIGSLTAGVFGEVFSRKHTMFAACCWVILGSYLYTGAKAGQTGLLYAGRYFLVPCGKP
ncbi:hypothetical protein LIPSTDRAFT_7354 [Lipomyces starkeyi NRRL Y-11557]|uniref:Major facilitator superfamily (MFS) profile domain-containing protein n=1 Tax=Lipomyces starkeyi NRRL Y-11557 TaxID=675824 RepID=A0A1E3PU88_LIPST|nr:hypothetical protein LIPSTDRAFT_7354 [Lipomyces starkeyi NRRL Y-11557]